MYMVTNMYQHYPCGGGGNPAEYTCIEVIDWVKITCTWVKCVLDQRHISHFGAFDLTYLNMLICGNPNANKQTI